jgi:hypothetical protein
MECEPDSRGRLKMFPANEAGSQFIWLEDPNEFNALTRYFVLH